MIGGTNQRSTEVRQARSRIRRGLADGTLALSHVIGNPPACLHTVFLFELATWRRGWSRSKLRELGARAIRDQVNLAIAAGDASDRTRTWLADRDREHGPYRHGHHFHHRGAST